MLMSCRDFVCMLFLLSVFSKESKSASLLFYFRKKERISFSDNLEITTAVDIPRGDHKTYPRTEIHSLVFSEYSTFLFITPNKHCCPTYSR